MNAILRPAPETSWLTLIADAADENTPAEPAPCRGLTCDLSPYSTVLVSAAELNAAELHSDVARWVDLTQGDAVDVGLRSDDWDLSRGVPHTGLTPAQRAA